MTGGSLPDPARLAGAAREVARFAAETGGTVIEEGRGRWLIERKPRFFKLGIYFWTAELREDGGLAISDRKWRPDPSYG